MDETHTTQERLAAFLFRLARDNVPFGVIEEHIQVVERYGFGEEQKYIADAAPMGEWARRAANRLAADSEAAYVEGLDVGRQQEMLSRTIVRALTSCPACGAGRGENCRRSRPHKRHGWVRIANHMERVEAAQRAARVP